MAEETNMNEVEIPVEMHVRCPLRQFHLIAARRCDGCERFAGLAEVYANAQAPFEKRYVVQCAHPTLRELCHVERDEA
ncbi:MAG: hypothetical protein AB1513_11420 [Pseudomonadota bacterium]